VTDAPAGCDLRTHRRDPSRLSDSRYRRI